MKKTKSTNVVNIEFDGNDLIRITLLETHVEFDLDEAKRQVELVAELTGNKPVLVLVDTRGSFSVPSLEAKEYIASVNYKIAEAILVKTLPNRILGNLYLKIIGNKYPSKMFTKEQEALEWLRKFKKD